MKGIGGMFLINGKGAVEKYGYSVTDRLYALKNTLQSIVGFSHGV